MGQLIYYKNATENCYKMRQLYYKVRQLLQIVTILFATGHTKCDVYYKLRQYKAWLLLTFLICLHNQ